MSSRGSKFSPSEKSLSGAGAAGPTTPIPAVVWGPNDDTRLLLRGLLRLNRHAVVYEARTLGDLELLPPSTQPRLLLVDVGADGGRWSDELARAVQLHSELRPLAILPAGRPDLEAQALRAGARAVLARPFAIQDFVRALAKAVG